MNEIISTERKIKETAKKLFTTNGFAATTIREIARNSGTNIALVNYYFRSKENLFKIIMEDSFDELFNQIEPILNNNQTSLKEKIHLIVNNYLDFLLKFPDLPIFILNEIKNNPEHLGNRLDIKQKLNQSSFVLQIREINPELNPIHFIFNLLGMIIFPFVMKPVISSAKLITDEEFRNIINERKKFIPLWFNQILFNKINV